MPEPKEFADAIAAYLESLPPGSTLHIEETNEFYEGEEAFAMMFGWMNPEAQQEWHDMIFDRPADAPSAGEEK